MFIATIAAHYDMARFFLSYFNDRNWATTKLKGFSPVEYRVRGKICTKTIIWMSLSIVQVKEKICDCRGKNIILGNFEHSIVFINHKFELTKWDHIFYKYSSSHGAIFWSSRETQHILRRKIIKEKRSIVIPFSLFTENALNIIVTCFCSILKSSKLFITRRRNDVYRINFWGAEVVFNKINQPSDSHGIQRDTLHVFINIGQKRTKHNSQVDSFSFSHMTIYKVEWHNVHTKKSNEASTTIAHSRIERMN